MTRLPRWTSCEGCKQRAWCAITIQSWRSVHRCFGCWLTAYRARMLMVVLLMLLAWPVATAQESVPQVPTLTDVQRLQLQNLSQQMEIAQLRFEAAKTELTRLVQTLQVPGHTLDLATLSYRAEMPKTKEATP